MHRSDERKAILDALEDGELSVPQIAAATGIDRNNVDQLLFKMAKADVESLLRHNISPWCLCKRRLSSNNGDFSLYLKLSMVKSHLQKFHAVDDASRQQSSVSGSHASLLNVSLCVLHPLPWLS